MILLKLPSRILLAALFLPLLQIEAAPAEVDHNIQLIEKRIQIKKETTELRSTWTTDKVELEQENALLDSELETLRQKLDALVLINNDLLVREQSATDSSEGQDRIIEHLKLSSGKYEEMLLKLTERLPPPLASDVVDELGLELDRQRKNIGARFQVIVNAINLIHRFNQKPFFAKETYESANGSAKQLESFYLGIAVGYRIDPTNSIVQIGGPSESEWVWSDAQEHAESIRQILSIHQGETTPIYVELPLKSLND